MGGSTVVLNYMKWNMRDKQMANGTTQKGVANGSLYGLAKHNHRTEIRNNYEHKINAGSNIDESKSQLNVYIKKMTSDDINKIKEQAKTASKNVAAVFSLVFDFKDEEPEGFDVEKHTELIELYLERSGISEEYEMIDLCFHGDEIANSHFHATFSGYSKTQNKFNINSFFEPELGVPILDKDGEIIYKKHNRGKLKGQFMLDDEGEQIPKRQKLSATQFFQDTWEEFLEEEAPNYQHDRDFASFFYYTKGIYMKFSPEEKERINVVREAERNYHKLLRDGYEAEALEIKGFILSEFADLNGYALDVAHEMFEEKHIEKEKRQEQRQNRNMTPTPY